MLSVQMLHIRSGAEHATPSARKQLRSNNTTALLAEIAACSGSIVESLEMKKKTKKNVIAHLPARFLPQKIVNDLLLQQKFRPYDPDAAAWSSA